MRITFGILILSSTVLLSCTPKHWTLTETKSSKIAINSAAEAVADKEMAAFVEGYKHNLDKTMNRVIGQSAQTLSSGKPESLLSNWCADVYLQAASEYLKTPVDMAVVNLGSLRAPIPEGDVTVGHIFRLMPFENELVVLWLKGTEILRLLNIFALEGGQGVAGIQMEIENAKAVNCRIQGHPIEPEKLYSVATNDFLAAGNDRMTPLVASQKRADTGIKIRDMLMRFVQQEHNSGRKLNAQKDGRIRVVGEGT